MLIVARSRKTREYDQGGLRDFPSRHTHRRFRGRAPSQHDARRRLEHCAIGRGLEQPLGADQEAGYDALRSSLDETIAKLVATKEQVNFAEATGDTMLLKRASADLSLALSNSTGYWEAQVRE